MLDAFFVSQHTRINLHKCPGCTTKMLYPLNIEIKYIGTKMLHRLVSHMSSYHISHKLYAKCMLFQVKFSTEFVCDILTNNMQKKYSSPIPKLSINLNFKYTI